MKRKIIFRIIQAVLCVLWALILSGSDAFPFIFALTAAFGVVTAVLNLRADLKRASEGNEPYKRHLPTVLVTSVILSGAVLLANYGLMGMYSESRLVQLAGFALIFLGGMCVFGNILTWMIRKAEASEAAKKSVKPYSFRANTVFFVSAAIFAAVYLMVLFLGYYPGITSPDSVNQIEQTFSGVYSNHHPFWHTMIIKITIDAGTAIFGNINAGVALYSVVQIFCMAFAFAYVIKTMYQFTLPYGVIIFCFLYFLLMPYHIFYSFTMWKDVLFGAAMAVFITSLWRIMENVKGGGKGQASDLILIFISGLGTCLLRSNGQIAFIVAFIAAIFVLGRRYAKTILILAAVLVVSVVLKYPVLSALGVTQPDTIESLSIPAQQIARVMADGGELSEDERDLLSNVVDVDRVAETYRWYTSDYIKDLVREKDNQGYISEHRMDFIKLYLKIGIEHPAGYIKGWIDATKGYYNGGYELWSWTIVNDNERGIERSELSPAFAEGFNRYTEIYSSIWILQPFVSMGLFSWITVLLLAAAIAARRKEGLLAVPLLAMIATLLIATPIYAEFRYAYALFTCMPVMAAALFTINSFNKDKTL